MAFEILHPSEGYVFANSDETAFYTALILGPKDAIENYHEVPIEVVPVEPEPDPEDDYPVIPVPDEGELPTQPLSRAELTEKVAALEDELAAAKILLGL